MPKVTNLSAPKINDMKRRISRAENRSTRLTSDSAPTLDPAFYQSGLRDVNDLFTGKSISGPGFLLERRGYSVSLHVDRVNLSSGYEMTGAVPPGFRPRTIVYAPGVAGDNVNNMVSLSVSENGTFRLRSGPDTSDIRATIHWVTPNLPPDTLPGSPA